MHSYPVLSEMEVVTELTSLFPERLGNIDFNFRNEDSIRAVMCSFVETLMAIPPTEQTMLPLTVLSKYTCHPEMHNNARYHFFTLCQRLARRACLSINMDFNDFSNPSPKRWLNIFSGLINFYKFVINRRCELKDIKLGRDALLEEKTKLERQCDELKHRKSEYDCRKVENEFQKKAVQRSIKAKIDTNKQIVTRLGELKITLEEQRRQLKKEIDLKEISIQSLRGVEGRLASVKFELVNTPIDQVETEVAQYKISLQRKQELFTQHQSRSTELQRQIENCKLSEQSIDVFINQLTEGISPIQKELYAMEVEHTSLSQRRQEIEREIKRLQSSVNSRKEASERQDSLIKLKLVFQENEKQFEVNERKMGSERVGLETDLKTMDARTETLNEQHKDICRRLSEMEEQKSRRLQHVNWCIQKREEALIDFQKRSKFILNKILTN